MDRLLSLTLSTFFFFTFIGSEASETNIAAPAEVRRLYQERVNLVKANLELKNTPQYFRSLFELGEVYWKHALEVGHDEALMKEAQKKWQALLETPKVNSEWKNRAHFALGESYFFQKNFPSAVEHYRAVRARSEVITALKKEIAKLSPTQEREKMVLENLLKESQSRLDLKIESQLRMVECWNRLGQYDKARQLIAESLPLATEKQQEKLVYQSVLADLMEGNSEAEKSLKIFQARYGFNALTEEAYWICIQKLLAKNQTEKAQHYLQELVDHYPQGSFSQESRALLEKVNEEQNVAKVTTSGEISWSEILSLAKSLRVKDPIQARQACDRIIAAPTQEVALKAEAMWLAGEVLRDQKEFAKAAGYFEMIDIFLGETVKDKSMKGLWEASQCYEKAGMNQEKKRVYESLLQRYPENPFRQQIESALKELS
jgi:tetratricopeptide (TPR) repeat protein